MEISVQGVTDTQYLLAHYENTRHNFAASYARAERKRAVVQAPPIEAPPVVEAPPPSVAVPPYVAPREFPDLKDINKEVCRFYKIGRADFISHRRTADVVRVRQVAMYLGRTLTPSSFPKIAKQIGDRDHTTVISGYRKICRLLLTDDRLAADIEQITFNVNETFAARNAASQEVAA